MITNFDYLKKESEFSTFADTAISAEKIILMDSGASILNSRRAMEFAVKWMYSVDDELEAIQRQFIQFNEVGTVRRFGSNRCFEKNGIYSKMW